MKRRVTVEVVNLEDTVAGVAAVLRYYAKHPERYTGVMVIATMPGGAYEVKYTGTSNVAERLGQLELLKDQMLDDAEEHPQEGAEWYAYLRRHH